MLPLCGSVGIDSVVTEALVDGALCERLSSRVVVTAVVVTGSGVRVANVAAA